MGGKRAIVEWGKKRTTKKRLESTSRKQAKDVTTSFLLPFPVVADGVLLCFARDVALMEATLTPVENYHVTISNHNADSFEMTVVALVPAVSASPFSFLFSFLSITSTSAVLSVRSLFFCVCVITFICLFLHWLFTKQKASVTDFSFFFVGGR